MNVLGIHALIWVSEWDTQNAERAVGLSADTGYGLVELPMLDPEAVDVDRVGKAVRDAKLQVACSLGLRFDADVSSEDRVVSRRGEDRLREALIASHRIGASLMTGILYSAFGRYGRFPSQAGWENAVGALRRLSEFGQSLGVRIGLEVVNRYESNLINTASSALRMLDSVDSENLSVHLDTYHMNIEEGDMSLPIVACGSRLGYLHAGESNRGYLGSGLVDFGAVCRSLAAIDYRGPITFEAFSSPFTKGELGLTVGAWRPLWRDPVDLALQARKYLEGSVAAAQAGTLARTEPADYLY